MADEKCEFLRKEAKGTTDAGLKVYYKCVKKKCDKECDIYVLWEEIEEKGLDGKMHYKGQRVLYVGCECTKVLGPPGPLPPTSKEECEDEVVQVEDGPMDGKTVHKSLARCNQGNKCDKECVFFIHYKGDKEFGEFVKFGCECVDWKKL
jgi:hypothetical protein